ncbi:hypothetical protein NM208_g10198 [Fusarium decemcellulare]|uniref:Uncharacterized protein n=1 Tax=Fusarium decemcellulare TaxID=57161 RepID=A0ACC1RYY4_9HYPO|nr:hypothetical protein NM208_g10198 [Fusarium decemcellulare]
MAPQVTQDGSEELVTTTDLRNGTTNTHISDTDTKERSHLDKFLSSQNPIGGEPEPPNGGLVAWLQVAAGFVLFFNTWGMISAFSVFQTYYESGELFETSSSNISWIGSIQCFLLQLTGLIAGPVYDRGYLRLLLATGSFMIVFGLMMLSLCTQYWQALLSQAFCVGIGAGLLFVPTVSVIPTWFSTHIGLAVGIASSGSSLGGVIYPIVLYRLISRVGFPWAVRSIAFIALATFMAPLAVLRMRAPVPKPRRSGGLVSVPRRPLHGLYDGPDRGFTDTSLAFYMAAIFNAGSALGRILPNALSDRIGVFNTMTPLTMLLGVTMLCLLGVHNPTGMIVEAVVTGFFSGVVIALPPICFHVLTENKSMVGTRIGQGFAIGGLGLLIGGPSAGAVLGTADPLNWTGLWVYGGVTACVASVILFGVRMMISGFTLSTKI